MSVRVTGATAVRVLTQLRRDPRTIVLLVGVPCLLIFLLKELFSGREEIFQHVGVPLLGLFPFISMFVVTSVTMLRERTTGTLERLMSLPLGKLDLLLGYGVAFALVAVVQASVVSALALGLLGLDVAGPVWPVVALAVGNAVLGMALGLFASAFARTEFQAVQFMPAFILPQVLLCGLLIPRDQMADGLQVIADILPLSFAYDALHDVSIDGADLAGVATEVLVLVAMVLAAIALAALTLRRRTA